MKIICLFLILLCMYLPSSAQRLHITDSGNVWRIEGFDNDGKQWGYEQWLYGDTLVNNHHYKFIASANYTPCMPCLYGLTTGPTPKHLIREDTQQKKVYICCDLDHIATDSSDFLLYDYAANIGDSVIGPHLFLSSNPHTPSGYVSSKATMVYNGQAYKVITVTSSSNAACKFTYVEGMGYIESPFGYTYVMSCFEGGALLKCFSTRWGNLPTAFYYYNWFGPTLYTNTCTNSILSLPQQEAIHISPNPVKDLAQITHIPDGANLQLINLNGEVLQSFNQTQEYLSLNMQNYNPGVYIVVVTQANGSLQKVKLMKW